MNIGFVSQALPYLPSRGGFRLYGANLIRVLSRRHQIHLVSLVIEDDAEHLDWARQYCASVRTIPVTSIGKLMAPVSALSAHLWGRPLQQRSAMAKLLWGSTRDWDILHVEGGYAGGIVPVNLPIAKVLSLHDSWTLRCDEMLKCANGLGEKLYYTFLRLHEPRYERLVYPRFEYSSVVAERDLKAVRKTVPGADVALIPYGVDADYYAPLNVAKGGSTLVFHGHLGYGPNIDAVLEFADNIFPLIRRAFPALTFHLVAADPVPQIRALASRPGIHLTVSPPDVRPALSSASIYVCPMRHGTGMKNKMLEAMAMQLPIVCYPSAIAGLDCVPGFHVLMADNPINFARHVIDLVHDPLRAETVARAGRALVEARYSWDLRAREFEDLYARAIADRVRRLSAYGGVPRHEVAEK